jgi:hypothetical protein
MVQTRAQIRKNNEQEICGNCDGYVDDGTRVIIEIKSKRGNCVVNGNTVQSNEFVVGQIYPAIRSAKMRRFDSARLAGSHQLVHFGSNTIPIQFHTLPLDG